MNNLSIANERVRHEVAVTEKFLEAPNEDSFSDLFNIFTPQLVAFFRARNCELPLAEDLAQEVMFTVHTKVAQIRDRTLFRGWLFKIAHNALCRHYGKKARELETMDVAEVSDRLIDASSEPGGTPAFEFLHRMALLDSRESEALTLRLIEQWEYHEIAAFQATPIGTVQWHVFSAKKKLAAHLAPCRTASREAA